MSNFPRSCEGCKNKEFLEDRGPNFRPPEYYDSAHRCESCSKIAANTALAAVGVSIAELAGVLKEHFGSQNKVASSAPQQMGVDLEVES